MQPYEIPLYSDIGDDDAANILQKIRSAGPNTPINVRINSPGGNVFQGYAIYNALLAHPAGATVYIDGMAASIAAYIAMAGRKISMADNAMLMIHNPTGGIHGDAATLRKRANLIDEITKSFAQAFVRRSKGQLSQEQVVAMMDEETWFTADMALAAGLIDEITPAMQMAAHFDTSAFKNVPPNLKEKLMPQPPITETKETEEKTATDETRINTDVIETSNPGIFEQLKSLLKPKAEMLADIAGYKTQIEVRDAAIVQLNAKIAEQDKKIEGFQKVAAEMVELEAAVKALKAEQKTVEDAAVDKVAALGFPQKDLPAATSDELKEEDEPDEKALLEKLNKITDPKEFTAAYRKMQKQIQAATMKKSSAARK
jgi:ATP-dependent Clp protease protease subunit